MHINQLSLNHFRNHSDTNLNFHPTMNVLLGANGTGKTNVLDAIHYLCMSRSFVATSDSVAIQKGESSFKIEGRFSGNIRAHFSVSCTYQRGEGKQFFVNESPLGRLSDLIGMVPVVVLSPQDRKLTSEGPTERRSFLDAMIAQSSSTYLYHLIEFRKIIKQRNAILGNESLSHQTKEIYIEPWNEQMTQVGVAIIEKRHQVLSQFDAYLKEAYHKMSAIQLEPSFVYKAPVDIEDSGTNLKLAFAELIQSYWEKELERGFTMIGPHRDDLVFYLDEMEVRKYGSQGQHKVLALSLKLAELMYLSDQLDDLPIFLLDDVFGDLDPEKIGVFIDLLKHHPAQTFITAANPALFSNHTDEKEITYFLFEQGKITPTHNVEP